MESNQQQLTTALKHPRLLPLLVCPRDKDHLCQQGNHLIRPQGHRYAVTDGIPILLISEVERTHIEGTRALAVAESDDASALPEFDAGPNEIDPFVRNSIGATNGGLYQHLVGTLTEYPIPRLRLAAGEKRSFLEIGCNWGRWCIAAARSGYCPVGIDPSLKSIRAACRVAKQLGVEAAFLVADGRFLPFRDQSFDQVFSYSVLQHLSKENTLTALMKFAALCESEEVHWSSCRTCTGYGACITRFVAAFANRGILRSDTGSRRNCSPPSVPELAIHA